MTIFTEGPHAGGFIVSEPDINLSRKVGVIATGSGVVKAGTVLALNSSTKKWAPVAASGSNNVDVAAGILFADVDATSADAEGVIVYNLASVNSGELIWPAGVNIATGTGQLATAGIVVLDATAPIITEGGYAIEFVSYPTGGVAAADLGDIVARIVNVHGMVINGDNTTSVTLAKTTGSGTLTGGGAKTAVKGIVTWTGIKLSAADTYTLTASASGLVSAVTGNIVVTSS